MRNIGRKIINGNAEVSESRYEPKKHTPKKYSEKYQPVDSAKRDTVKKIAIYGVSLALTFGGAFEIIRRALEARRAQDEAYEESLKKEEYSQIAFGYVKDEKFDEEQNKYSIKLGYEDDFIVIHFKETATDYYTKKVKLKYLGKEISPKELDRKINVGDLVKVGLDYSFYFTYGQIDQSDFSDEPEEELTEEEKEKQSWEHNQYNGLAVLEHEG